MTGTSGGAGPDTDEPPTATDLARIGSVTKTMTGTILLQLVDEGLISLDDPVSQYVSGRPNGTATIQQVADMTSGIPSYSLYQGWQDQYFSDPATTTPRSRSWTSPRSCGAVRARRGMAVLEHELCDPRDDHRAGHRTADRTGLPGGLFDPLGMDATVFPGDYEGIGSPHMSGVTDRGSRTAPSPSRPTGTRPTCTPRARSSRRSTTWEKWAHALFTGEGVLSPAMQDVRRESILTSPPPNTETAGYGIGIGNRNGWWGHTGEIPGYNTALFHNYDTETT